MKMINDLSLALSLDTRKLVNDKCGYRDDGIFGDGITDIKAVVRHETFVLWNQDIPDTILALYSDILSPEEIKILEQCRVQEVERDDFSDYIEDFQNICYKIAKFTTGNPKPTCRWLASKDAVVNYYHGDEHFIDKYELPDSFCILADIGYDGALFAW